jgi:hypothetical protein
VSYAAITPEYYQMLQPDTPWRAGAPGWTAAPFPGWGENPNLRGPARLAVNGCGCSAVGADAAVVPPVSEGGPGPYMVALGVLGLAGVLLLTVAK